MYDWFSMRFKESFDNLEKEQIGVGKHEEFHSLLSELKQSYLD